MHLQYIICCCLIVSCYGMNNVDEFSPKNGNVTNNYRNGKWFGIGLVRFENAWCVGRDSLEGTCYTRRQCREIEGGVASGRCASNIGVCCVIQKSCGDVSAYNNTYFVNPRFPSPDTGDITCTLTIPKCHPEICQLRIDFLSFSLAQPNGNGICDVDSMTIVGGSKVPIICGENSGQHVYVEFNGNQDIRITFTTSGMAGFHRNWKLKVAQIGCDCPTLAPSGCLQYHTAATGTVSSFNYGQTVSAAITPGTRQLANTNYGICVAMQPGHCSITWAPVAGDLFAFTVSGDTQGATLAGTVGTPVEGIMGMECTTDFIVVPHPCRADTVPPEWIDYDRFCGNYLPPLTTGSKPFVLTVVTDGDEANDVANRGFSLMYTQHRCSGQQTANRDCVF